MRLLSLELRNYRNYAHLELEPAPGLNLLLGANGQGKTNLLESVALLALTSSPRARHDSDLVGPLAPETRILATVEAGRRRSDIRISIHMDGSRSRRQIQVDGRPRRAFDLPGLFRVTLFWPDDLGLVKGGPELRRRLLNQLLVQVRPGYARTLGRYTRALEQRNHLLKQIMRGDQGFSALEVWDLELARLGAELAEARSKALESLAPAAATAHALISSGEQLEVTYAGPPSDLLAAIEGTRAEDVRRGVTTVGPHRDDLVLQIDGRSARGFASQGQQRTAVVSLKMAEAALIEANTGEPPVLLLDDVLSELDAVRRGSLLDRLGGPGQVIVTSVELGPFPPDLVGRAAVRCIESGALSACA